MDSMRRQFLERSGTAIGAVAAASLAGCTDSLGGGDGGDDQATDDSETDGNDGDPENNASEPGDDDGEGTDGDEADGTFDGTFTDWLYVPDAITGSHHYGFSRREPATIVEHEDEFAEETFYQLESTFGDQYRFLGVSMEDVETSLQFDTDNAAVLAGEQLPTESAQEVLTDGDYEESGEYAGYQLYVRSDREQAVGIGSNVIVIGRSMTATDGSGTAVRGDGESGSTQDLRSISYGESWQGQIDESDPEEYRGHYEPVTFQGTAGDVVTIDMYADDDTYLVLLGPEGEAVAFNDDHESLNSRIVEHELEETGEHTIVATSYDNSDTFTYTLTLTLRESRIDPTTVVETIVDAANGDETRYADDSGAFAELESQLYTATLGGGSTHDEYEETATEWGRFEGAVGTGWAYAIRGELTELQYVITFSDPDHIDAGEIEDWTEESDSFEDVTEVSVSTDGRSAIVTGQMETTVL